MTAVPPHRMAMDRRLPVAVTGRVDVAVCRHFYKVTGRSLTVDGRAYPSLRGAIGMSLSTGPPRPGTPPPGPSLVALMGRGDLDPARVTADELLARDALAACIAERRLHPAMEAMVRGARLAERSAAPCDGHPVSGCAGSVAALAPAQWPPVLAVAAATGWEPCEALRMLDGLPDATRDVFAVLLDDGMGYRDALAAARLLA